MIFVVTTSPRERAAFDALCESRGWPCVPCESLRTFKKALNQVSPHVVLARHRLGDGYSDDVLATLAAAGLLPAVKVFVLLEPGATSAQQARQLALGADGVLRDPVRTDVLIEYLTKYRQRAKNPEQRTPPSSARRSFRFAGAEIQSVDRLVKCDGRRVHVTPREIQLVEILHEFQGEVVTYETLYSEILGIRFRGETSNMRVLLGRLDASFRTVGIGLRNWVEVIPKTGYRYAPENPIQPAGQPRSGFAPDSPPPIAAGIRSAAMPPISGLTSATRVRPADGSRRPGVVRGDAAEDRVSLRRTRQPAAVDRRTSP